MTIHEYIRTQRRIQETIVPSSVIQLKKIAEKLNIQNQTAVSFMPVFQKNYVPIEQVISAFKIHNSPILQLTQIAEKLKVAVPDLSVFEYHFDNFLGEEIEEETLIEVVGSTKLLIKRIYDDHNLLDEIDPRKFEEIVAELLYSKGFEVRLTKRTKDNGYDILALQKISGFPLKFLVECKRSKKNIGIGIIRSFCDVIRREQANMGIIFTTSYFSKDSQRRKSEMGTILDFKDREDIIAWVIDYSKG